MTILIKDDRYQHQSWYIKLWRQRYMLLVPYYALPIWYEGQIRMLQGSDDWIPLKTCWSLAKGMMQGHYMKWWYTSEELGYNFSQYIEDDCDEDSSTDGECDVV